MLSGSLIFIGSCLAMVKALLRDRFGPLTLFTTLITATLVGLPLLMILSSYFNWGNIFYGIDRRGFAAYLLMVAACVGLLIWGLGQAIRKAVRHGFLIEALPPQG